MILIADSGATSTTWALLTEGRELRYVTLGMNPMTSPDAELDAAAQNVLQKLPHMPSQLFFYGAGCGNTLAEERMYRLLSKTFPNTLITVESDMLGACRAMCGATSGRVAILGTGSNVCYYNGTTISKRMPSLGYLLGDEGSGNHIGRLLLKGYLEGSMPEDIKVMFHDHYNMEYAEIIDRIYRRADVSRFLASFVPFVVEQREHPYLQELLNAAFSAFLELLVVPLGHWNEPLHLVGGVAYQFRDEIAALCKQVGNMPLGNIVADPMEGLVHYHTRR